MTSTPAAKSEDTYHGYRFLIDATGSREYAIRYDNGMVKPPLQVFDTATGGKGSFKPNETVYAFDDDVRTSTKDGSLIVSTIGYQITTNAEGRPVNLKQIGVDYVMTFSLAPGAAPEVVYTVTPETKLRMQDSHNRFDPAFPEILRGKLEENGFDTQRTASGLILPQAKDALAQAPFPPHRVDSAALTARTLLEKPLEKTVAPPVAPRTPASSPYRYMMVDEQTLVEKKDIGDGQTLKIVFNFESRRVTESVIGAGITSYKFDEYDQTALDSAATLLRRLGGTPRPVDKKPALPRQGVG